MNPNLRDELAAIIASAQPPPPPPPDDVLFRPVDVSERAKKIRGIVRIADAYAWHDAIVLFLETKGVSYLGDLTDPQLDDLAGRMDGYVDAAETGASLADCFPAS